MGVVRRKAYTLMELMTVVAIIALIAAIGVPGFLEMQWRAKRAELEQNTHALMLTQMAYHAAQDRYLNANLWVPTGPPGKKKKAWPSGTAYDLLGFRPDGSMYGRYNAFTGAYCLDLNVEGQQNLDGLAGTQGYGCCVGEQHYFFHMVDGRCGYQYGLDTF